MYKGTQVTTASLQYFLPLTANLASNIDNKHQELYETYRPGHSPAGQTLTTYYSNIEQKRQT